MTWAKHAMLKLYDGLTILIAALLLAAALPLPAFAYVDPSVMTYTIQALAGVAVALSAVLGVALRRTRKVIMRILHIDENANKEIDPLVHRTYDGREADKAAIAAKVRLHGEKRAKHLTYWGRFWRALLACLFLIGTVFVVAPLEVVAGSASSLIFGAGDVAALVVGTGIVCSTLLAVLVSFIRNRAFDIILTLIVALGLCCYVQAMFLNGPLPIADGHALDLSSYKTITVISTTAWAAIFICLLIFNHQRLRIWRMTAMGLCAFLVVVQGVGIASVATSRSVHTEDIVVTEEGLFDVGAQSNVVVFVLDTFDTQNMDQLLAEEPGVLDEFTGFTYFRDSVGSMVPTRYGIPFLLTGVMPDGSQSFNEFIDSWYTNSTLLPDLAKSGYDIGVYSDSIEGSYMGKRDIEGKEFVADYARNLQDQGAITLNPLGTLLILDKVALYRDAPWILKPLFWFYTDDVNNEAISKENADATPYTIDDVTYSNELFDRGLSIGSAENVFRFIHLNGIHIPYVLDREGHEALDGSTLEDQCVGSLAIVKAYLAELKRLGLYDEATIIITADHGDWYLTPDPITKPTSPIMLVKPAENAEEAAAPLKVSYVPTGHLDYAATIIDALGGAASSDYGPSVFEVQAGDRPRYYWMTTSDGHNDQQLIEFAINGPVLDFDNWSLTGNVIEVHAEEIKKAAA